MKEFKLRFTADVADIEAQFKGAAKELKQFAAGVASAENQLEALQQTGAYLAQMDKQLSELKKKYPDIFNKIFGNVDAQVKAALEPLMKSPKLVSKAVNMIGNQLSGISTGKLHARGPVGLEGLTTYKYQLSGSGQIVKDYAAGTKQFTHRELM